MTPANPLSTIRIMLLNIRSMRANFDALQAKIEAEALNFDIICLTETWVRKDEMFKFKLPGYNLEIQERPGKQSGGVAIFYKNELRVTISEIESLFFNGLTFKIIGDNHSIMSGMLVYRFCGYGGSVDGFLADLEVAAQSLTNKSIILGDVNIDLLSPSANKNKYVSVMSSMGFMSVVNSVTREVGSHTSCLDHCFIRDSRIKNTSQIKLAIVHKSEAVPFSDHFLVTFGVNLISPKTDKINVEVKKTDWGKVAEGLAGINWDFLETLSVDSMFESFSNIINEVIEANTKTRKIPARSRGRCAWVSKKLIALCDKQKKLFSSLKHNPDRDYLKVQLRNIKIAIRKQVKMDKKTYFGNVLNEQMNNPKKYWSLLKGLANETRTPLSEVEINDSIIKVEGNELLVADSFNKYFSTIVTNLLSEQGSLSDNLRVGLGPWNSNSFRFFEITPSEIFKVVMGLKNTASRGVDNVSTNFLKNNIDLLVKPLCLMFNKSLRLGIFPVCYKTAIVVPLFKSGDRSKITNYRPISLLSVVSKVLEKLIHTRLLNFLQKYNFFADNQFGFLPGKSVDLALTKHIREIVGGVEDRKYTFAVYCDIMKAFDSVNPIILLNKLENAGVRGTVWEWFKSYLSGRSQRVKICDTIGGSEVMQLGVPQGSSLGPLLFLIYVNDLLKLNLKGSIFSFADDTALIYKAQSYDVILQDITADMTQVKEWFESHHLFINFKKTNFLTFGNKTNPILPGGLRIHKNANCAIDCNCPIIMQAGAVRYLGLNFDPHLNWNVHITSLVSRLKKLNYQIFHLSKILPTSHVLRFYKAIYEPILRFGIVHWGNTHASTLDPVIKMQKWAIRSIAGVPPDTPSQPLFDKFNILNVTQLNEIEKCSFGHRNVSKLGRVPPPSSNSRLSKDRLRIAIPHWKTEKGRMQSPYSIPTYYNKLPITVRKINSFKAFRKAIRKKLMPEPSSSIGGSQ